MQIRIASHAQCKHTRRIQNREDPHNPMKGTPIPGSLTPTEIAHKARRRARRTSKFSNDLKAIPFEIERINTLLIKLEKETPKDAKEKQDNADRIVHLRATRDRLETQLKKATASLSRLLS